MVLNGEIPRKAIILTTKVFESLIDSIPVNVRQKMSSGFNTATYCAAIIVPFLYAATNKNSNFLSRN